MNATCAHANAYPVEGGSVVVTEGHEYPITGYCPDCDALLWGES